MLTETERKSLKLDALLRTRVAERALEEIEAGRASKRSAVLAEMKAARPPLEKKALALAKAADKAREELQRRKLAADEALAQLMHAEAEAISASKAIDRSESAAIVALRELGNESIDSAVWRAVTVRDYLLAFTTAFPVITERTWTGGIRHITTPIAERTSYKAAMRLDALIAELEALRFADVAPAEIERRCDEAVKEAIRLRDSGGRDTGGPAEAAA